MMTTNMHRAVVLGAGMAGLSIAQALSEHVEQVTVVDRDHLDARAEPRRGVPQGRHVHVLQLRGLDALEGLFPGLGQELVAHGASAADWGARGRFVLGGNRLAQGAFGREWIIASRPMLEQHLFRRVAANTNVVLTGDCDVLAPTTTAGDEQVTGVRIRSHAEGAEERTLPADLVVDCTGRGSRTSTWLRELGYREPPTDELRIDLAYSSCHYRLPPDAVDDDVTIVIGPTPEAPCGGTLFRIEDDRWIVSLAGIAGTTPPTDPATYESFAAGLPAPDIHAALTAGERLDDPVRYRFPANVRRRYERLRRFPAGLLVAGDAVCAFNPVYGQGMSVAALEAEHLRELLDDGGPPEPRTWFRAVAGIVKAPWDMATGADLALPQVEGHRPLATRLLNAYLARYQAAAAHDPVLADRFISVVNLLDGPERLLHPANILRTARWAAPPPVGLSSLRPAGRRRAAWTTRSVARSSGSPTGSWPLDR